MQTSFKVILILFISVYGICLADNDQEFSASEPVLITSAGQSADILMVKILAQKSALDFKLDKVATPEMVDSVKSVILVCGGSTKGLGAAKIDKEQEYERVKKLIDRAKSKKITMILVHVGGKSRRGALSDYFNQLVAENANHMIVVQAGNEDGYFSEIANKLGIGIDLPDKIAAVQKTLEKIYQKTKNEN